MKPWGNKLERKKAPLKQSRAYYSQRFVNRLKDSSKKDGNFINCCFRKEFCSCRNFHNEKNAFDKCFAMHENFEWEKE